MAETGTRDMNRIHAASGSQVDVAATGPAPCREPAGQVESDDGADGGDFLVAHCGRAHFQFLHAGIGEHPGDGELFGQRENHARRLFAIAKRRIDQPRSCTFRFTGHEGHLLAIYAICSDGSGLPDSRASRISSSFCSVIS